MNKGWQYESYRHALAARGIQTNYYAKKKVPNAIVYKDAPKDAAYDKVGIDSKGRTVRLYSKAHKEKVGKAKFGRIEKLLKKYPTILAQVEKDIDSKDMVKRDNARAMYVILKTGLRPGSYKETQGDVQAYGVSTLKDSQVTVSGNAVRFKFIGKKGVKIDKVVIDPTMARIIREQKALKRNEIFTGATDSSLRDYVKKFGNYKTKDFRTLYANEVAKKLVKKGVDKKEVIEKVAEELQNTPGVSKGAYIAPAVLDTYDAKKIDLKKYAGTWRQKDVSPEPFYQRGLTKVTATYTPRKDGTIKVVNTGVTKDGKVKRIEGTAKPVSADNRELDVTFGKSRIAQFLMHGSYKIKKINKDYTKATVKGGDGTTWHLER